MIATSGLLVGCYHVKSIALPEYERVENRKEKPDEIYVKTKDGKWYHYTNSQYYIINDTMYGYGNFLSDEWKNVEDTKIALSDIESIGIEDIDYFITGLLFVAAAGGIFIFAAFGVWLFSTEKEIHPN